MTSTQRLPVSLTPLDVALARLLDARRLTTPAHLLCAAARLG